MKIAFYGNQELFLRLKKLFPDLQPWEQEAQWDIVLLEDWTYLSAEERMTVNTAVRCGLHVLSVASGVFIAPGFAFPVHWFPPPFRVFDESNTVVNVEVLGAFDLMSVDEISLIPGYTIHRADTQEKVTCEFWSSSRSGKVIISALQLFRPSLYSDEQQRKVILTDLFTRLCTSREHYLLSSLSAEAVPSQEMDTWQRQILLAALVQPKSQSSRATKNDHVVSDEEMYRLQLEDPSFLAQEVDRLLPYAFRRRLGV